MFDQSKITRPRRAMKKGEFYAGRRNERGKSPFRLGQEEWFLTLTCFDPL